MSAPGWQYVLASVAGTSHIALGKGCQDASDCRVMQTHGGRPVLVSVASDGAGSAKYAEVGSRLICSLFMNEITALMESGGDIADITREYIEQWVAHLHLEIEARADAEGTASRDLAGTLLAAIVGAEKAVFCQVGDGAIVVASNDEPGQYCWIFWPQNGEYENETYFLTDDTACDHLMYEMLDQEINEVAVFTDGLQRLAAAG